MTRAERNYEKVRAREAAARGETIYVGEKTGIAQALQPGYEQQAAQITAQNQAAVQAAQEAKREKAIAEGGKRSAASQEKIAAMDAEKRAREQALRSQRPGISGQATGGGVQASSVQGSVRDSVGERRVITPGQQTQVKTPERSYGPQPGKGGIQRSSLPGSVSTPQQVGTQKFQQRYTQVAKPIIIQERKILRQEKEAIQKRSYQPKPKDYSAPKEKANEPFVAEPATHVPGIEQEGFKNVSYVAEAPRSSFKEAPSGYTLDLAERLSQQASREKGVFKSFGLRVGAAGLAAIGTVFSPADLAIAVKKDAPGVFKAIKTKIAGGIKGVRQLGVKEFGLRKGSEFGEALRSKPDVIAGKVGGEILLAKGTGVVIGKTTSYVDNVITPAVQKRFNPAYLTPEETGIKFVPSVTEPISPTDILRREGTRSTGIHATMSPFFKFDDAGEILIRAQPQGVGAKRISLDQYSFYKSLSETSGTPRAYLGYVGIGEGVSESTTKFVLTKPDVRLLVFKDELISPTPKGLSAAQVQAYQGSTSGQTFLGVENIKGMSIEAQTVSPAKIEYLVKGTGKKGFVEARSFDTLDAAQKFSKSGEFKSPILEYKGYPGTIVKKGKELGFTYYAESVVPKWIPKDSVAERLYKGLKLDVKSTRLNILEAETRAVPSITAAAPASISLKPGQTSFSYNVPVQKTFIKSNKLNPLTYQTGDVSKTFETNLLPKTSITTAEITSSQSTRYISLKDVLPRQAGKPLVLISQSRQPVSSVKSSIPSRAISPGVSKMSVPKMLSLVRSSPILSRGKSSFPKGVSRPSRGISPSPRVSVPRGVSSPRSMVSPPRTILSPGPSVSPPRGVITSGLPTPRPRPPVTPRPHFQFPQQVKGVQKPRQFGFKLSQPRRYSPTLYSSIGGVKLAKGKKRKTARLSGFEVREI